MISVISEDNGHQSQYNPMPEKCWDGKILNHNGKLYSVVIFMQSVQIF